MPTWTSPHTWIDGELVGASGLNTHVRDNLNALANPNNFAIELTTGVYSATSTTFVNVAPAFTTALVTQNGGPVLLGAGGAFANISLGCTILVLDIDGTQYPIVSALGGGEVAGLFDYTRLVTGLSIASHTVSLKWRVAAGNTTATMNMTVSPGRLYAIEL